MRLPLFFAAVFLCALAASPANARKKERAPPAAVAPVTVGTVRYEAPPWGKSRGLTQNGGHVVAIDQASGRELWTTRIYRIRYDRGRENDKQDVFITSLAAAPDGKTLSVGNESGERFRLDLATRRVVRERP